MDCNQAQFAMMEHMEQTIHPAQASKLAKHVLECESCREYFVGFDMALDVLGDEELSAPPTDFTMAVMNEVKKLPAHAPAQPAESTSVAIRVLWGLSAIFLGVSLLFVFNPEWLTAIIESSPVVEGILGAFGAAWQFIAGVFDGVVPSYQASTGGLSMFNIAIVFVAVMGILLVVLHRSEKSHNS